MLITTQSGLRARHSGGSAQTPVYTCLTFVHVLLLLCMMTSYFLELNAFDGLSCHREPKAMARARVMAEGQEQFFDTDSH